MGKEPNETLRRSIFTAFDRWAVQYANELQSSRNDKTKEEVQKDAYLLNLFLTKRVFIPGFMRHVIKQVSSNPVSQRQRKTLIKACLISIVNPKGVTAKELEKNSQSDEGYTYTHTRRIIRDEYPEAFFETKEKRKDERFTPYLSVFSPYELPEHIAEELVRQLQKKNIIMSSNRRLKDWVLLNARIRSAIPEYLEDLLSFKNETLAIMRELLYDSELGKLLHFELKYLSDILTVFHAHFQSIMAVEWWRSRRKQTKRKLIDDGFPLKYDNNEAVTARSILLELTKSQEDTAYILRKAALAFKEYNLPEATISLFRQCLETETYTPLQKGSLHENIAVILRETSKPKLMVQEMKKAVEYFRKGNDIYRLCVSLKNLGEAVWMLGFKEAGLRYFAETESMIDQLKQLERAKVLGNLAYSARRLGEKNMEIEYLIKQLKEIPEEYTEEIVRVDRRLSELMG